MNEIKKIVVPIDFQEHTDKLTAFALHVANKFGANVSFINVVEHLDLHGGYVHPSWDQIEKDRLNRATELMSNLVDDSKNVLESTACRGLAASGDIVDSVIAFAKDEKADMIIIGTHGRRGMEKILLGSVAERVLKRTPCPILLFNPYHQ